MPSGLLHGLAVQAQIQSFYLCLLIDPYPTGQATYDLENDEAGEGTPYDGR